MDFKIHICIPFGSTKKYFDTQQQFPKIDTRHRQIHKRKDIISAAQLGGGGLYLRPLSEESSSRIYLSACHSAMYSLQIQQIQQIKYNSVSLTSPIYLFLPCKHHRWGKGLFRCLKAFAAVLTHDLSSANTEKSVSKKKCKIQTGS